MNPLLREFCEQLGIEEELQERLYDCATITHHHKGDLIIKENQYIKVLKIVLRGKVRVYQESADRQILIYYLSKNETCTLSLSACFEDCMSTVSARVEEESTLLNIPVRFVKDWSFTHSSWNRFTINIFRTSYSVLLERYAKLAFSPLQERLVNYLNDESRNSVLQRSHSQIAKELGTTREVVSRLLKKLEYEGTIALAQKKITLL